LLVFRDCDSGGSDCWDCESGGSDCWDRESGGSNCSYSGIVIQEGAIARIHCGHSLVACFMVSLFVWCLRTDSTCMFYQAYPVDFIEFIGFFEFFFSFHAHICTTFPFHGAARCKLAVSDMNSGKSASTVVIACPSQPVLDQPVLAQPVLAQPVLDQASPGQFNRAR